MEASKILENLNEEQLKAVTHTEGPLMIIAGAGTGKTTVMTRRIAWLIEQKKAEADEILALTFTDKAAGEMEERIDQLLPYGYVDLWVSTFHAFCQRILEAHGVDIGLSNDVELLTEVDAWLLMRQEFERFELVYYKPLGNPTKFLRALLQHFSRAKDDGVTPKAYREWLRAQTDLEEDERVRIEELVTAYETYEQILRDHNAIDFGGLLTEVYRLFQDRPTILKKYQRHFKYIIVDEFQDTNWVQYQIVKLLGAGHKNVAVVGDDDQAIYRFRGASIQNIHDFEQDYPETERVVLTKNYRSLQTILDKAYDFIALNNPNRLEAMLKESHGLDKQLKSQLVGEGTVRHLHAESLEDEVEAVTREILKLRVSTECDWSDIAILVRANDTAEPYLQAFDRANVPYRFMAMRGLYRKPIVLDAISLLRVIDRPYHSPSVYRILSHPEIGIPERDLVTLTHYAKRKGRAIIEVVNEVADQVSPDALTRLKEFSDFLADMRALSKRRNALEVFAEALKQSGLYGSLLTLDEEVQVEESQVLQQFYERIRRFVRVSEHASLHDFLLEFEEEQASGEEGGLALDEQAGPNEVRVMTLHGAKGLEFRYVFIVGLVDRRFPSARRSDPIPLPEGLNKSGDTDKQAHLEEERRLMYVGMTRAKEGLYLTSGEDYGGARKKKISQFLDEMGYAPPDTPLTFTKNFLEKIAVKDRLATIGRELPVPSAFSFTQLVAYEHCPLQYKFAHVLKIPVFGSAAMSYGKTMHNTLQAFFERVVAASSGTTLSALTNDSQGQDGPGSLSELLELYEQCWIDDWYESTAQVDKYRKEGEESLRAYHKELSEHPPSPLFLERGFTIKIDDIVIKGRIDRIDAADGGVEIIDYKTGTPKEEGKLSASDKMQLLLYQIAAKEVFGLEPVKLTFHYLKDHSRISFLGTDDDIVKLKKKIRETIAGIRDRSFPATPGFQCRFCDFRDICPFRRS